ncbi:MAG: LemA family protein [Alloprevotella sp.]
MKLSKSSVTLISLAVVVVVLLLGVVSTYNGLVTKDEAATTAWAGVQTQYQRRADLIPNLVNTVKGYAKHESETLENVVSARARATQMTIDPTNASAEQLQQYQAAQGELSQAIGRLLMVAENYPDLKANENFSELQAQLEGTENRINESRQLYNAAVQDYNVSVRRFPTNIVAGLFGFGQKSKFEAAAGTETAPTVSF